jgi:hypothetical protein
MKKLVRHPGLFLNGSRYWYRVRAPGGICERRSTGTDNLVLANRIAQMIDAMQEERTQHEWLLLAANGAISRSTCCTTTTLQARCTSCASTAAGEGRGRGHGPGP